MTKELDEQLSLITLVGYAALNRVDSAKLEDRRPSGVLSVDQILLTESKGATIA